MSNATPITKDGLGPIDTPTKRGRDLWFDNTGLPLRSRDRWLYSISTNWLVVSLACSAILIPVLFAVGLKRGGKSKQQSQPIVPQPPQSSQAHQGSRDAVWVCDHNAPPLSRRLDAEQDQHVTLELMKLYEQGEPIDPAEMPKSFVLRGKRVPADIMISAFLFVSKDVAEILRLFDLGENSLFKLDGIYRGREKKRLPKDYFILMQENRKEAFSPGDCDQRWIRQMSRIIPQWGIFVSDAPDNAFAVTENAMSGPDIWRDRDVPQQLFLSDRLKTALDAQGIGRKLGLKRCRVVPLKVQGRACTF